MKPELVDLYAARDQIELIIESYETKHPTFKIESIEVIKNELRTDCGVIRSTHIELDARIKVQP